MQTKCYASLDFFLFFDANVFFTRMRMRNVHMMHMSHFRGAIFMMQMSHVMVRMQHLSMMVPVHVFTYDANVSLQRWRCECLLMDMSWCTCPFGYVMMRMSSCRYVMMQMSMWVYNDANVLLGMQWCKCFDADIIHSKIPFIFKTRLPQRLKPNIFKTWFIILEKSSSFWLKAPKKNGDHC